MLGDVSRRLEDRTFPCVFARNAFRKGLVRFVFVEGWGDDDVRGLGDALAEYVDVSRTWDGSLDTAYPLVVAFSLDAVEVESVEDYHAFGWRVLNALHEIDPSPWPQDVGTSPDSHTWSMCFNGMPLFCNMSSPPHQIRRSRNLGGHFIIVINPRERFDIFAGDTPSGRNTRARIRSRIDHYDGVPHSSDLGSYGTDGLEWWQYGLPEEDTSRRGECPFRQ